MTSRAHYDPSLEESYRTLGVPSAASLREVRLAYVRLARELHPDHFEQMPAVREAVEERFKRVTAAYRQVIEARSRTAKQVSEAPSSASTAHQEAPRWPGGEPKKSGVLARVLDVTLELLLDKGGGLIIGAIIWMWAFSRFGIKGVVAAVVVFPIMIVLLQALRDRIR